MAREMNIELGKVNPTGIKGQVTKDDLLAYQNHHASIPAPDAPAAAAPAAAPAASQPILTRGGTHVHADTEIKVTGIQKVMVKTMTAAASIPTLGFSDEICVDNLIALRKRVTEKAKASGVKLSYFAFIIKAMSLALNKYPMLNAHVNADCSVITQKGAHNIGLAMDTPKGLLVPNIKNVQDLSILEIGAELNRLQALGKDGKLGPDDLRGGTITLSNIGSIGGTYCQPILVVPEACIGALGRFTQKAGFRADGTVYPSTVMNIGWTADHRALDGATVARFSNEMKALIENPEDMILY
jgi:2-oxoisovalerate dehydrogenase E2 component (dihydrolipoyl transacylase)